MKSYTTPQIEFVELDNTDVIATSDMVVSDTQGSTQLGNERGGNPIWD